MSCVPTLIYYNLFMCVVFDSLVSNISQFFITYPTNTLYIIKNSNFMVPVIRRSERIDTSNKKGINSMGLVPLT